MAQDFVLFLMCWWQGQCGHKLSMWGRVASKRDFFSSIYVKNPLHHAVDTWVNLGHSSLWNECIFIYHWNMRTATSVRAAFQRYCKSRFQGCALFGFLQVFFQTVGWSLNLCLPPRLTPGYFVFLSAVEVVQEYNAGTAFLRIWKHSAAVNLTGGWRLWLFHRSSVVLVYSWLKKNRETILLYSGKL